MKKWEKITFVVATLLLASGGVISIMGYQLGANVNDALENTAISINKTKESEKKVARDTLKGADESMLKTVNEKLNAFKNIEIDSEQLQINVLSGTEYRIKGEKLFQVEFEVKGDTLVLKQDKISDEIKRKQKSLLDKGSIIIYVPKDTKLNDIKVKAGVGIIDLEGLDTKMLDLTAGVGTVSIKDTFAKNCFVEGGVGEVIAENVTTKCLDISSGVGLVQFNGTVEGNITIEGGVGSTELNLKGDEKDYNYNIQQGLGAITVNGIQKAKFHGELKEEPSSNNAPYTITANGGLGAIEINISK